VSNRGAVDAADVARRYLELFAQGSPAEGDWTADETIDDRLDSAPEDLWKIILELVRVASDDRSLFYVAARPLEDLLLRHGPAFVDRVDQETAAIPSSGAA
jgi:hypothetical protein